MPFNFSFTSSALCKAMCHSHTLFLPISSTPASYCKLQSARPAAALASRSGSAKGIRCNASEQLSAVSATEPLQPLTKARKKLKVPNARSAGRGLQSAGSVVSYAALAFGAGVAMMAVAGPEAAAASAVLAAGAAILPSIGPGARNKAQVSVKEGHQTMLGAFSSGPAAKHVTAAIQQAVKPSTRSSHKPLQSCFHSLAPNMSTSEQSDTGLETQWDNEEDLEDDDQGMTNAQWAAIAKMIEQQPSQVGMGDAHQFVQTFDSSQRLLGQIVENQQGQVLSLTLQEPQQRLNNVQEQARKREKHKRKERKNRQKRK